MNDFPLELYAAILAHMKLSDLATCATISSKFQLEAESLLYTSVDLSTNVSGKRVLSWCTTISSVRRKALLVNFLKFPTGIGGDTPSEFDFAAGQVVATAFLALENLKHLILMGGGSNPPNHISIHPSILTACPFKLTSFLGYNKSFNVDNTLHFLSTQPDIEYWVPTHPFWEACTSFPKTTLPRLRRLVCVKPQKVSLLWGRPLDSLVILELESHFTRSIGMDVIGPLRPFSSTLHTLTFTHHSLQDDWSTPALIRYLAEVAPNLKWLTLNSFAEWSSTTGVKEQGDLVGAVANLHLIETLILNTNMEALYVSNNQPVLDSPEETKEWEKYSMNPAQCLKVATEFMEACPHLHQLSFPIRSIDKEDTAKSMTYLRRSDGSNGATFDGFRSVDTSGWWMK